jgi:transposase
MDARQVRGMEIAEKGGLQQTQKGWVVPSQSGRVQYMVKTSHGATFCTCPDCQVRGVKCKHQYAVEYYLQKIKDAQGNTITTKIIRKTYPQNWKAYTMAQNSEIELFDRLLSDLVADVEEPPQEGAGRRRISVNDLLFCAIQKVYSQLSSRRAKTLYGNAKGREQIRKDPNYNSINIFLNRPDLTPILHRLLTLSALPLKSVESTFAQDSSGFATTRFNQYCIAKHNTKKQHRWVKAHLLTGVKTNVVVGARITDETANDCPHLKPMIEEAHLNGFEIREVVADRAYSSRENLIAVNEIGAVPYIPFKSSATGRAIGSMFWAKMYHYFQFNREEFMQHYHQRSNAETTFQMIKSKFGERLKSKNQKAQENELLCKLIAHNIVVLIHEMHELEINPEFKT